MHKKMLKRMFLTSAVAVAVMAPWAAPASAAPSAGTLAIAGTLTTPVWTGAVAPSSGTVGLWSSMACAGAGGGACNVQVNGWATGSCVSWQAAVTGVMSVDGTTARLVGTLQSTAGVVRLSGTAFTATSSGSVTATLGTALVGGAAEDCLTRQQSSMYFAGNLTYALL